MAKTIGTLTLTINTDQVIAESAKIFKAASDIVDEQYGRDYAKRNPQLTSSVVDLFSKVFLSKVQTAGHTLETNPAFDTEKDIGGR